MTMKDRDRCTRDLGRRPLEDHQRLHSTFFGGPVEVSQDAASVQPLQTLGPGVSGISSYRPTVTVLQQDEAGSRRITTIANIELTGSVGALRWSE